MINAPKGMGIHCCATPEVFLEKAFLIRQVVVNKTFGIKIIFYLKKIIEKRLAIIKWLTFLIF
jgi:hypothetical protein